MRIPRPAFPGPATLLGLALLSGCGPAPEKPLPDESDLRAYSIAVAERALRLAPHQQALGLFHLGKVHERFGLEDRAVELYRQAAAKDLSLWEAPRSIGHILSQRKDQMREAIEAYQTALISRPDAPGIHSRIGLVLLHMGKLPEALISFDEEIRAGTADADTHYTRGQTLAQLNRQDDAASAYREALKLAPEHRSAQYALAQALRSAGKKDEAEEADRRFREIKQREEEAAARSEKVTSSRKQEEGNAARTWLDAAALFAAESQSLDGKPEQLSRIQAEYLAALEAAKRLAPGDPEPRQVLIAHHEKSGDLSAMARECDQALTAFPAEAGFAGPAFVAALKLAERARGPGDPTLPFCHSLLARALGARPSFGEAHRELARLILFRLEPTRPHLEEASTHARSAVTLLGDAQSYDLLAFAQLKLGQGSAALATLEEGVQRHPEDTQLRDRLAKYRERQQR